MFEERSEHGHRQVEGSGAGGGGVVGVLVLVGLLGGGVAAAVDACRCLFALLSLRPGWC